MQAAMASLRAWETWDVSAELAAIEAGQTAAQYCDEQHDIQKRVGAGFSLSFDLFGADLKPAARRFAVAETLSHLERLVREERAVRREDDGHVSYTAR